MAIFIDVKVAKNGNNWLQIIAKFGNKMITLPLYRNLSHIFAIFWQHFASKNCQKWQFYIDLKVAKNGNNWLQIIAKVGNKMVTLSLHRNLSHILAILAIFGNILLPKVAKNGNFY